jgi:arsenical pump membrane protein
MRKEGLLAMHAVLSVALFTATVSMVIRQPKGLNIAVPAVCGALLALLLRLVTLRDVVAVTSIVWDATLSFISLMIISLVLDSLGFSEWSALHIVRLARGSGKLLFIYSIALGSVVAAFFNNDGAAMILTPIMLAQVRALRFPDAMVLPFVMASGFVADTTSFPLVISNLVNIVSADYFHLPFFAYASRMLVPNVFSLAASIGMLYLVYRKSIPARFDTALLRRPSEAIRSPVLFKLSWGILLLLLLGYGFSVWLRLPLSLFAGAAALLFAAAAWRTRVMKPAGVAAGAPWHIIVFSIGMYVVVYGLRGAGMTDLLGSWIHAFARYGLFPATFGMGFLAALLSAVMNNLPSVLIGSLAIDAVRGLSGAAKEALVYANIIGCDLGPKMTPIGSLATLIWLHILKRKGVVVTWSYFMRIGAVLTLPTLAVALLGLALQLSFLHRTH